LLELSLLCPRAINQDVASANYTKKLVLRSVSDI
jgi:hypothetical protein